MSEKFFPSTEWTALIQIIQTGNSDEAWEGIARFCERYREPIKTYFQTLCRNPERAEDLTQDFIHVRVLKKNGGFILDSEKSKGRFRSFLKRCAYYFFLDEQDRLRTEKAGGRVRHEPYEELAVSPDFTPATIPTEAAEALDFSFAQTVVSQVVKNEKNQRLLAAVLNDVGPKELSKQWNMSEGAAKQQLFHFRRDLARKLRAEVRQTLGPEATATEIDQEIRYLITLLQKNNLTSSSLFSEGPMNGEQFPDNTPPYAPGKHPSDDDDDGYAAGAAALAPR